MTAVAVWEWGQYLGEEALAQGVDVQVSSWNRPAPNTLPAMAKAAGNYLGGSLIKMEAILNGFKEGIALTVDGYLSEGSGENLSSSATACSTRPRRRCPSCLASPATP